jgi:hypothetical protein
MDRRNKPRATNGLHLERSRRRRRRRRRMTMRRGWRRKIALLEPDKRISDPFLTSIIVGQNRGKHVELTHGSDAAPLPISRPRSLGPQINGQKFCATGASANVPAN